MNEHSSRIASTMVCAAIRLCSKSHTTYVVEYKIYVGEQENIMTVIARWSQAAQGHDL